MGILKWLLRLLLGLVLFPVVCLALLVFSLVALCADRDFSQFKLPGYCLRRQQSAPLRLSEAPAAIGAGTARPR